LAERYYNSRKGNLDKSGEPDSHWSARLKLKKILEFNGFKVLCVREDQQNKASSINITFPFTRYEYQKAFDIFAQKYFNDTNMTLTIIIEVDGLETRHVDPKQQKRDRFAQALALIIFDNLEFRRVDKEYVNSPEATDEKIINALKLKGVLKWEYPKLEKDEPFTPPLPNSLDDAKWVDKYLEGDL
jgi:hypothetical protein